jgi:hypothetical protein
LDFDVLNITNRIAAYDNNKKAKTQASKQASLIGSSLELWKKAQLNTVQPRRIERLESLTSSLSVPE